MPRPNKILLVPDICLLDIDPNQANQYTIKIFVLQLLQFLSEIQRLRDGENEQADLCFYFSPELINSLLTNDFPWCEFNNPSIRELVTPLTALLNSVRVEKFHLRPSNGCTLQPDLSQNAVHLHPYTKAAWRTLISTCEHSWRTNDSAYYIKIATALNVPPHSFLRVVRNDETVGLVELILQNQLDETLIWARESLPRSGDYRFMPHASWSGHAPFPKGKIRGSKKREPRDESNMIWQWDMLHQNHWDVQTVKGVRQARVTPDGRELPLNE